MNPPENRSAKAKIYNVFLPAARLELPLGGIIKRNASPGIPPFQGRLMPAVVEADTSPNYVLCKCGSLKTSVQG